jgi:hypothetical protein
MGLPRTFVGFSSTDIKYYWLMLAWKENEHIDFIFTDCQLSNEIRSEDEQYIKSKVRQRINMAGKYVLLVGEDTRYKYKYVKWEAEVAIEKGCTIIGVNLDGAHQIVERTCPPVIRNVGAIFVPFSPKIIAYALENYQMHPNDDYHYKDEVYQKLG